MEHRQFYLFFSRAVKIQSVEILQAMLQTTHRRSWSLMTSFPAVGLKQIPTRIEICKSITAFPIHSHMGNAVIELQIWLKTWMREHTSNAWNLIGLCSVKCKRTYTVFQIKNIHSYIIGYKLRNSCLILIIFDTKIPHIICHRMTA